LSTPEKDRENTIPPENTPGKENRYRQTQSPIVSNSAPTPRQNNQSDRDKNKTPLWKKIAEISIAASTVGLLFVTGAYAIVSYRQWRELQRSIEISNRAWVGVSRPIDVTGLLLDPKHGKASYIITIKNYGPSVGRYVMVSAHVATERSEAIVAQLQACKEAEAESNRITNSVGHLWGDTLFPSDEEGRHFDDDEFQFNLEPSTLIISGCIAYRDQFGKPRRTRFCYWRREGIKGMVFPVLLYAFPGLNDAE
jgi:hypothetical protein